MSYAIHLKQASASFQYAANYSYICPYITCSFWHACRQMSPVRVTTWAALTSRLVPESLQLNTVLWKTWKKGQWEHLTSSKQIMNTEKLSAFAEPIVTSTLSQWKLYALWHLLNSLHFPTKFTILLLTIAGDWKSVSRLWLKTLRGGMSCKTCVSRSYINLKRRSFLFACPVISFLEEWLHPLHATAYLFKQKTTLPYMEVYSSGLGVTVCRSQLKQAHVLK